MPLGADRAYPESVASRERVGVLVIRVWMEADGGMRARMTQTVDVEAPDSEVTVETTAATEEDLLETVRSWLEAYRSPEV